VKDRTAILAEIPVQIELNDEKEVVKREKRFKRREEYVLDRKGWYGDHGGGGGEIKVVSVMFEDASFANGHEAIGFLAMCAYGAGVIFNEVAHYPDREW
jgi:hypothetical protein